MSWTLSDIINRITFNTKLEDQQDFNPTLLVNIVNASIRYAGNIARKAGSNYLQTYFQPEVQAGDSTIALPDDIYHTMIEGIYFSDGTTKYKLSPIPIREIPFVDAGAPYRYILTNSSIGGPKYSIFPSIRRQSTTDFTVWYHRKPRVLVNNSDICDFGDHIDFICAKSEYDLLCLYPDPVLLPKAKEEYERQEAAFMETMMIPSDDSQENLPTLDQSFYEDHE